MTHASLFDTKETSFTNLLYEQYVFIQMLMTTYDLIICTKLPNMMVSLPTDFMNMNYGERMTELR